MTEEKVKQLEQKLAKSDDFSGIFGFFMDHFGEKEEFIEISEKAQIPFISRVLGEMGQMFFKKQMIVMIGPHVFKVKRWKLLHGQAFIENHLTVFFYSKKVNMGLICMTNLLGGPAHYFRVTPQMLNGDEVPDDIFEDLYETNDN